MLLCEADGKRLLARHGIPVPDGAVLDTGDPVGVRPGVVKAQLLSGGRKLGQLVSVDHADTAGAVRAIRARLAALGLPGAVLVEDRLAIAREFYLAIRPDGNAGGLELLFSTDGGVAVEEAPERIGRLSLHPGRRTTAQDVTPLLLQAGVRGVLLPRLARLAADLVRVAMAEDADLIEINPLAVLEDGRPVAADAKVSLDDGAHFRHPERSFPLSRRLHVAGQSALERAAEDAGCSCVEMPGDVALVTAGAGLGMLMLDLLADAGFTAATFFDNAPGGPADSTETRLRLAFEAARQPGVRAIAFYQLLATRDLRPRVEALLRLLDEAPPPKPFFVGLSASYTAERNMTTAEAHGAIRARGHRVVATPEELVAGMQAALA